MSLQRMRERIRRCQDALARSSGEAEALEAELKRERVKLQKLLGCEPGGEAAAVKALRLKVESLEAELEELLAEAEGAEG